MYEIMDQWRVDATTAMRSYVAQMRAIEQMEAEAACLLAVVVRAYHWPENQDLPSRCDGYGVEMIDDQPYGEDLSAELAVAGRSSVGAARFLVGDVARLGERLPGCWEAVTSGRAQLWQARRVAQACEQMSVSACQIIDDMVAPCLGAVGIGRLTRVIAAAVAAADPDRVRRVAEMGSSRWVRTGGDGVDPLSGWVSARVERADAVFLDATIQLIADVLAHQGDDADQDRRRARALGLLANPAAVVQLIGVHTTRDVDPGSADDDGKQALVAQAATLVPSFRPRAQLYVHIVSDGVLDPDGLARVEGIGPVLLDQVASLTRGCSVSLTPVVQLGASAMVDAYEIPHRIREHVILGNPYDVFPWSSIESRHVDLDHTRAFQPGRLAQTATDNLGPLSRRAHRVKTHAGWSLEQPAPGVFIWHTPAGQAVRVDHRGSYRLRAAPDSCVT